MGDISSAGHKMGMKTGIHWRVPTAMIVCFVLGLALAISHHFYYYSLNNTTVGSQTQQSWALRIGTGMAFLTKTFLTTAVGLACVQNLWWILRLKPVSLSTLDSMWDIRGSIFNFFDFHIWLKGPNVAILGLISWTIPLVTVVTPATLSVQSVLVSRVSPQQLLPDFDWDFLKFTTMSDGGPGAPAPVVTRFISSVIMEGTVRSLVAPAPNSTYTHTFIAPYIQCEKGREGINASMQHWHARPSIFRTTYVGFEAQTGNISYDLDMLFDWESAGLSPDTPLAEDIVDKVILAVSPYMPTRTLVECAMYNATWTVDFGFHNGEQTQNITDISILNRVPAYPEMHEAPKPSYQDKQFGYAAVMNVFKEMLVGRCRYNPLVCSDTQIFKTILSNTEEMHGLMWDDGEDDQDLPNFLDATIQLGKNITLSLLAEPYFHLNSSYAHTINVTIYENETRYLYSQKNLFIAYGVAVFVTLLCVIAGFLTMWDNGIAFTDSLSTILRTTRNKKFDEIVPDDSTSGADPPPQSLSKSRVMWVSSRGSDDTAAGLKPIPAVAEPEKAENTGSSSPITYSNRIWERKSYRQTSTRVDNTSPEGFI